ncbi:MAG: DegQ family serine endoprotease [Arenicella sp.]
MKTLLAQQRQLLTFFSLMVFGNLLAQAKIPFSVEGQPLPSLAPMLELVQPAIVNISTVTHVSVPSSSLFFDDPFFRHFFDAPREQQPRSRKRQGLGSGVIFDARNGFILTNSHVIDKADEINITLKDGREFKAEVIGSDKESDVAVIKIEAEGLTAIPVGNSDALRVGDFVVAIGNPFGLRQTVTSGIVSALGRSGLGIEGYEDLIQTDAPINPGNSGGALVNLRGELVGINTAIFSPSGGSVGINFAIPVNMALQLKSQLVRYGEVQRGRLGVHIQDLTPALAEALSTTQVKGAIVAKVEEGSTAEQAGLKGGDIVINCNGRDIENGAALRNQIGLVRVGDDVVMQILRNDEPMTIIARMESVEADNKVGQSLNPRLEGATFSELTDQKLSQNVSGILITKVERNSAAWFYGLREGDIIQSANRQAVTDLESFRNALKLKDAILLNIIRNGGGLFVLLQ